MLWSDRFYVDRRGRSPVGKFLTEESTAADRARLKLILEKFIRPYGTGPEVPHEIAHAVEEFFQIRFCGCRVLTYRHPDKPKEFVLLHAFKKKEQKTPPDDKQKARNNQKIDEDIIAATKKQAEKAKEKKNE